MFDSTGDQSQDKEARPCLESRRAQMSHTLCDLIKDGIAIHCIVCRLRFVAMGLSRVGRVGLLVEEELRFYIHWLISDFDTPAAKQALLDALQSHRLLVEACECIG